MPQTTQRQKKLKNTVYFNEEGNHALLKKSQDSDDDKYQKIYAYMERMSGNDESSSRDFGDSS